MIENYEYRANQRRELLFFVYLIVLVITLFPLLRVGFTTMDDSNHALAVLTEPSLWNTAYDTGTALGRFSMFIGYFISFLPFLDPSNYYYKFIALGSVVINFILYGFLIRTYFKNNAFAWLLSLLVLVFVQNSWEHSLLTSYPFAFHFSLSLFFISLILLKKYLESKKSALLLISAILFAISTLTYEMFLTFVIFFFLIILCYRKELQHSDGRALRPILLASAPYLGAAFLMGMMYILWSKLHPISYGGATVGSFSLKAILKVDFWYGVSSAPLSMLFYYRDFINHYTDSYTGFSLHPVQILQAARVEWIVKALIVAYTVYYLLQRGREAFSGKKLFGTVLVALVMIFLPSFLPALTPKYQEWVRTGSIAYTVTYFSFFGMVLLLGTLLHQVHRMLCGKRFSAVFTICLCLIVGGVSFLTDCSNFYIAKTQEMAMYKWRTVNEFLMKPEFAQVPDGSVIYAPTLWKKIGILASKDDYWTTYLKAKTGKDLHVVQTGEEMSKYTGSNPAAASNLYYLRYEQEPRDKKQFISFAKVARVESVGDSLRFLADEAHVYSYAPDKELYVFGLLDNAAKSETVTINSEPVGPLDGNSFGVVVHGLGQKEPMPSVGVQAKGLRVESLGISYYTGIEPQVSAISPAFKNGFYEPENSAGHSWRWAQSRAVVTLTNQSSQERTVTLSADLFSGYQEKSNMTIASQTFSDRVPFNSAGATYTKQVTIPGKTSLDITFETDAKAVDAPNDSRTLFFRMEKFNVH